jgi:hypothetical protein
MNVCSCLFEKNKRIPNYKKTNECILDFFSNYIKKHKAVRESNVCESFVSESFGDGR